MKYCEQVLWFRGNAGQFLFFVCTEAKSMDLPIKEYRGTHSCQMTRSLLEVQLK